MKKKIRKVMVSLALLAIPGGIIAWLFWSEGWKISIIGLVLFISILFNMAAQRALNAEIKEEEKNNEKNI